MTVSTPPSPKLLSLMSKQKLLVDTHYLIWDMMGHHRFTPTIEKKIKRHQGHCYFSTISYWELGMLVGKGRIEMPVTLTQFFDDLIKKRHYKPLPLSPQVADHTRKFANTFHGDPADRIIVATALEHNAVVLTADEKIRALNYLETY